MDINFFMKTKAIKQKVKFKVSPHDVYEALMDSEKHGAFSGAPANISRDIGGKINAYGEWIEGENTELVPDKKIVQKWRGKDWPSGVFSIATFSLKKVSDGTELTFTHKGVPDEFYDHIEKGWEEHYWSKMRKFFGE